MARCIIAARMVIGTFMRLTGQRIDGAVPRNTGASSNCMTKARDD